MLTRKYILLSLFAVCSLTLGAQNLTKWGIKAGGWALKYNLAGGAQYTKSSDLQFALSASYPVLKKKNPLNTFMSSGVDYTGGGTNLSGLNFKPIQIQTFFSESFYNDNPFTVLLGCDGGYLFNFMGGHNGVVITPNLYVDYKSLFVKTGYDFNISKKESSFYMRFGICFGLGTWKMLPADVDIW